MGMISTRTKLVAGRTWRVETASVVSGMSSIRGLAVMVTIVGPSASGFANVWGRGTRSTNTSSINAEPGFVGAFPNLVVFPTTGALCDLRA